MHILSTEQIRSVENSSFQNGLPVAALMEKAGLALFARFNSIFSTSTHKCIGVLAGPGHNGADALVLARELHLQGRAIFPIEKISASNT
jgi:NAD(P)H-hydrate epimerase